MIAALEAVRELINEGRQLARQAADRHGDAHGQLAAVFGSATHPRAASTLDRIGQAAESIGEADGHAAVALDDIGEYIEVVRGNGPGGGVSTSTTSGGATSAGSGWNPSAHLRDMPPFEPDRKTHGTTTGPNEKPRKLISGTKDPDTGALDWRYRDGVRLAQRLRIVPPRAVLTVAGDVELKHALQMRRDKTKSSHLTINNPDGPCPGDMGCDTLLPVWLEQDAELTVHWRDRQGQPQSKSYKGAPDA